MVEDKIKAALIAEFNAIPPIEELEKMHTFSERHNKMMEALFAEVRRRERFERYFRAVKKIAIVMLALLGGAFVSLKVIPTVYAYVEAWITENADDRLIFKDKDNGENSGERTEVRFELGYVPEGYELVGEECTQTGIGIILSYKHCDGTTLQLKYYGKLGETQLSMNTEGVVVEKIEIEDITYYLFDSKDENIILTWEKGDYLFKLKGVFEKQTMLEIATSVNDRGSK